MANGNSGAGYGEALAALLQFVFSLTFPLIAITLCGISYLLAFVFHMPEFGFWAVLAMQALDYAKTNMWVAAGIGVFALAALPLAWVAFREQEVKASNTILAYVMTGIVIGFTIWLRTAWPLERSGWQVLVYSGLLLLACIMVIESAISTLGIVAHLRRNRPKPVKLPAQEPHGTRDTRRSRDEPETI